MKYKIERLCTFYFTQIGTCMNDFMYFNRNMDINTNIYNVNRAGPSIVNSSFHIKRDRVYPYCVLHYVINGSGWVKKNRIKYLLKRGDLFILNAYQSHEYATDWENPLRINWMEFSGGDSIRLIEAVLSRKSMVWDGPLSSMVNDYMLKVFDILNEDSVDKQYEISKLIYSLLIYMLEQGKGSNTDGLGAATVSHIKPVIDYIEFNLDKDLSVDQLAKIACLDPTYFAKLFRTVRNITPAKYVTLKRINKAKEILAGETIPIGQISYNLGFCSPSHLIKSFKKAEGLTPAEFREQCLQYRNKK